MLSPKLIGKFYIEVIPETYAVEYEASLTPTVLDIFDANWQTEHVINASGEPRFISMAGRYGMKIIGKTDGSGSVGGLPLQQRGRPPPMPTSRSPSASAPASNAPAITTPASPGRRWR